MKNTSQNKVMCKKSKLMETVIFNIITSLDRHWGHQGFKILWVLLF